VQVFYVLWKNIFGYWTNKQKSIKWLGVYYDTIFNDKNYQLFVIASMLFDVPIAF